MKKHRMPIIKKLLSVFLLILFVIFIFYDHAAFPASSREKILLPELIKERRLLKIGKTKPAEIFENKEREKLTETLEMMEMWVVDKPADMPGLSENKKDLRKNAERIFSEITLSQLDESENTSDDMYFQYYYGNIIFLRRVDEFALYGMNDKRHTRGLILRRDDSLFLIDVDYLAPSLTFPDLFVKDFDGDGKKEPAIILYRLRGTGYYVEELLLLDHTENEDISGWNLYQFEEEDYLNQIEKGLIVEIIPEKYQVIMRTSDNSQEICIDLSEEWEFKDDHTVLEKETVIGDIVMFNIENEKIKIRFDVALVSKEYATPMFFELIPQVEAEVFYQNGEFKLGTLKFVDDTDS